MRNLSDRNVRPPLALVRTVTHPSGATGMHTSPFGSWVVAPRCMQTLPGTMRRKSLLLSPSMTSSVSRTMTSQQSLPQLTLSDTHVKPSPVHRRQRLKGIFSECLYQAETNISELDLLLFGSCVTQVQIIKRIHLHHSIAIAISTIALTNGHQLNSRRGITIYEQA
jgi:hypothetical protein